MISIHKSDDGFFVRNTGRNNEILKSTEHLITKQGCWKNIFAEARNYNATKFKVCDYTGVIVKKYSVELLSNKYTKLLIY